MKVAVNDQATVVMGNLAVQGDTFETHVCPYCKSLDISEAPDRQPIEVQVTGDWAQVNKLLTEGWQIKNTYAKEYHLWKCKP